VTRIEARVNTTQDYTKALMRAVPVPIPRRGESDLRPVVSAAPSRPNSRQAGVSLRLLARANQPKPAKPITAIAEVEVSGSVANCPGATSEIRRSTEDKVCWRSQDMPAGRADRLALARD
jgi:hypothetical protein